MERVTIRDLRNRGGDVVDRVAAAAGADPSLTAGVLAEVAERFHDTAVVARREAERRSELSGVAPILVEAPVQSAEVRDLAGLLELGNHVWR